MAPFSIKFGSLYAILLIFGFLFPAIAKAAIPAAERQALIDLYNSTNGAGWTNKTGWLGAAGTECSWFGITCDAGGSTVIYVDLRSNQLSGSIPTTFGSLTSLQYLYLDSNQLSGSIPTTLGNLASLQGIMLMSNQLSGNIPTTLGSLTHLRYLNTASAPVPSWQCPWWEPDSHSELPYRHAPTRERLSRWPERGHRARGLAGWKSAETSP